MSKVGDYNKHTSFPGYMLYGTAITAGAIGCRALKPGNKGDSFTRTIKNGAKDYVSKERKGIAYLAEKVNLNKFAEYIKKVDNKKLFPALCVLDLLGVAIGTKLTFKLFGKD